MISPPPQVNRNSSIELRKPLSTTFGYSTPSYPRMKPATANNNFVSRNKSALGKQAFSSSNPNLNRVKLNQAEREPISNLLQARQPVRSYNKY